MTPSHNDPMLDSARRRATLHHAALISTAAFGIVLLCAALGARAATLAGDSSYDLSWHTFDSGGGTSTGGAYELAGTIGQPDAGEMAGGDYVLAGGFWTAGNVDEPQCPTLGDLNCDGIVSGADVGLLLSAWGPCADCDDCPADLTGDCAVSGADLGILLSNWTN